MSSQEKSETSLSDLQMPKTQQEALNALVSGVTLAQSRGAFKIGESAQLAAAIALFQTNNSKKASVEE